MKCPGQDSRFWKPGSIFNVNCPGCGAEVEFFKDDTARKCRRCGHRFVNPHMDFGCAAYCEFASQCIGTLPDDVLIRREELLKDKVALEMKRYFKTDFKRIGHAMRVARHAERIAKTEGANLAVALTAAYLHDIGIVEAEKKYGGSQGRFQEKEGPPIARNILEKLGAQPKLIEAVESIIDHHHHPGAHESLEFKVVYDADLLAGYEDRKTALRIGKQKMTALIDRLFLTETGKQEAKRLLAQ